MNKVDKFDNMGIENSLELIGLLEELNMEIPIYDYSRRNKIYAHRMNKQKLKDYKRKLL